MAYDRDTMYMRLAILEAERGLQEKQFPVGGVLVIDDSIVAQVHNNMIGNSTSTAHAENQLIINNGQEIRKAVKESKLIEIFTTLEPCIMCLGSSIMNRVSRIVYACPDPMGGTANLKPFNKFYDRIWPKIQIGEYGKESHQLILNFLNAQPEKSGWRELLPYMQNLEI